MLTFTALCLTAPLVHAVLDRASFRIPPFRLGKVRYRRVGGLAFLRIGQVQMSWCICRN